MENPARDTFSAHSKTLESTGLKAKATGESLLKFSFPAVVNAQLLRETLVKQIFAKKWKRKRCKKANISLNTQLHDLKICQLSLQLLNVYFDSLPFIHTFKKTPSPFGYAVPEFEVLL